MDKESRKDKSTGINGYELLLETYNLHKFPIIRNQANATVFPWSMVRDVDVIDTMKFYKDTEAVNNSPKNNQLK